MIEQMFVAYIKLEQLPVEVIKRHGGRGGKTQRYDVTRLAGYYPPFERLKTEKGIVFMYLMENRGIINSPDNRRADKRLQAKDSLNFSSIYLLDNSMPTNSGYFVGYGNPDRAKTYSKDKRPNPFYESRNDGFVFIITPDWKTIEILVVPDGCNTILGNAKALADGVYNEALNTMRATAKPFFNY